MANLKALLTKLNETSRGALGRASSLSLSRTNYEVDIEHWLTELLAASNTDLHRIADHFGVDTSRL